MIWKLYHNTPPEALGFIPDFVFDFDPRPAREQFAARYAHGGGWHPLKGFKQSSTGELLYPGDPPLKVLAEAKLRDEIIRVHTFDWVSITQPDGSFEASRID